MSSTRSYGPSDPDVLQATRGLISYLRDLVQTTRAPVRDHEKFRETWWLADLPEGTEGIDGADGTTVLSLPLDPKEPAPLPPARLHGLVHGDLNDPDAQPRLLHPDPPAPDTRAHNSRPAGHSEHAMIMTPAHEHDEHHETEAVFQHWLGQWRAWAHKESRARPRRDLHAQLARAARQLSLNDDTVELVLAVGLLRWRAPAGDQVRRHLVTARASITVDRRTSHLTVTLLEEYPCQLEDTLFLKPDDGFQPERADSVREKLGDEDPSPLSEEMVAVLRAWQSQALDCPVRFSPEWGQPEHSDPAPSGTDGSISAASISFSPALILRDRDRNGLVQYYERINASLARANAVAPLGLAQLLFPLGSESRRAWSVASGRDHTRLLREEPLFPLPVNQAQHAVFDRLRRETGVVVQGPPGTGKTHTIANLLAALLAEGKRVLVTSAKDQALDVLLDEEMFPPQLRDLCVRLAHQRRHGLQELERTLTALSDHAAVLDLTEVQHRVRLLQQQRDQARQSLSRAWQQVWHARLAETLDHGGGVTSYTGTRADIAEKVRTRQGRYGWIGTAPASMSPTPPITDAQAGDLLRLLRDDHSNTSARLRQMFVDRATLPTADEFATLVAQASRPTPSNELVDSLCALTDQRLTAVQAHIAHAQAALRRMRLPQQASQWPHTDWRTTALTDRMAKNRLILWRQARDAADRAQHHLDTIGSLGLHHIPDPQVHGDEATRMATVIERWQQTAGSGRPRRSLKPRAQREAEQVLRQSGIALSALTSPTDLHALLVILRAAADLPAMRDRWAQVGAPLPHPQRLLACLQEMADRAPAFRYIDAFTDALTQLDQHLLAGGVHHALTTPSAWDMTASAVPAAQTRAATLAARETIQAALNRVAPVTDRHRLAPEHHALARAIIALDVPAYARAADALDLAVHERNAQQRREDLLGRLRAVHPDLARRLETDRHAPEWDHRLTELADAWTWSHTTTSLTRGDADDVDHERTVQDDLDQADERVRQVTAELAAYRAWQHCLERMTPTQRQALVTYKNRMSDLGRGTSRRYAARYRQAAREALSLARDAVPAWIMPVELVAETIPPDPDSFDVVIVDEASQLGVEAAFLLWLAPHVIVVGDDQQCSPTASRHGELQPLFDRLDTCLADVPLSHRSEFSPTSNFYKLLEARFPETKRLTDHYRCMPEIISWSSRNFYGGSLVSLRQFGSDRLPPLEVTQVAGAYTEGREDRIHNPVEAKHIIEKLKELFTDPAYSGKTFGIISLHRRGQALYLDQLIDEELPDLAEREARRLRVGTPEEFQGDQRDVIILSMVVTEPHQAVGGRRDQRQRWNVAASRARDQMWLFTSVPAHRLKPEDLRHSLLTHMLAPPPLETTPPELDDVSPNVPRHPFESLFEQRVFLAIRERGYQVIPQVPAGAGKRIDLVVVGTGSRLAVECDGRHWHRTPDQVRADIQRERELTIAGWRFHRIRESDFILNRERTLAPLWAALERRGIHPD